MSVDITPSRLSASAKIALFEQSTQRRRRSCQQNAAGPHSSPSFQRPTQSSASRAAFTVISPNTSAVKHPTRPTNTRAWCTPHETVARVVSPCQQVGSTPHPKSTKKRVNGAVPNANLTTVVTPQKESILTKSSHRQLGMLLSPTISSKNTHHQYTAVMTPAPSSTPSPASRNKINRRIDYSVRKARVRDSDSADIEDLQELLRMKEEECQEKEEEKRTLTARLKRIDQGLRDIERERTSLFNKATRLETEKMHLKKELDNREQEVKRLTRRCASEQKRVEESTNLRASSKRLAAQLENMQKLHHQERINLETVRQQLKECQDDRDRVVQRLKSLDIELCDVKQNLVDCLSQNGKLMEERSAWEAEKQLLARQAQLDLEQKLQSHHQITMALQDQLVSKDEAIRCLEQIVKGKDSESLVLHQRLAELENDQNHRQTEENRARSIISSSQKEAGNQERIQLLEESLLNKCLELNEMRQTLVETKNELETSNASLHTYRRLGSVENFEELLRLQNQGRFKLPFEMEIRSARIRKLENALDDNYATINGLRRSLLDATRELEMSRLQNQENNKRLTEEARALKSALGEQADAKAKMDKVCSDLELCRSERNSLMEQLRCVEQNYSLLEAASRKLMEERCAWEAERRGLVESSEIRLKQQREDQTILQEEIIALDNTIKELRDALQEAETSSSNTRKELEHAKDEVEASRKEIDHLRYSVNQLEERIEDLKTEHLNVLSGKDAMIMALGDNVHDFLSRLMLVSSSLEQADENKKRFEELNSEIRSLRHENDSLADRLQQSNVVAIELQAEILREQIEKSLSTMHRSKGSEISDAIYDHQPDNTEEEIEIGQIRQGLEIDEDLALLRRAVVELEKERDELRSECEGLQASVENATNDRRGLLVSLEKHAASVEKLKELDESTLKKLAGCRQDLEAARVQIKSRDEKIKVLESEQNVVFNKNDNELLLSLPSCLRLVDIDVQHTSFDSSSMSVRNNPRSSKLNGFTVSDSKAASGKSKCIGRRVADRIVTPVPLSPETPVSKENIQTADESLASDLSMNFVSMSMNDSSVDLDDEVELEQLLTCEE